MFNSTADVLWAFSQLLCEYENNNKGSGAAEGAKQRKRNVCNNGSLYYSK